MARDILKTLQAEHDALRELFGAIKETTDRATRKRETLLEEIEANLMPHAKWEEQVFYPAFRERADRDGLQTYAEAVEEHRAVENTVIPDVHDADVQTPEFAGRVKVFGEFIDHHATEEEKTMFKMARRLFSAAERAQLDEEYEAWKQSDAAAKLMAREKAKGAQKGAEKSLLQ
jgi:hemerythrin-like domain-containing protein